MVNNIEFYNIGKENKKLIKQVLEEACCYLGQTGELCSEISFVGKKRIKEINYEIRGIDKVTDVLSFQYLEGIKGKNVYEFVSDEEKENGKVFIGEILICKSVAKEQAEAYGHSFEREIAFLALHGFLHLLGYDHIKDEERVEMEGLQKSILEKAGFLR